MVVNISVKLSALFFLSKVTVVSSRLVLIFYFRIVISLQTVVVDIYKKTVLKIFIMFRSSCRTFFNQIQVLCHKCPWILLNCLFLPLIIWIQGINKSTHGIWKKMQREIWLNILQICNYKQSFLVRVPSLLVVKSIHFLVFNQRIFTFEDFWFLYIAQGSSWCKKFFLDRNWSRIDQEVIQEVQLYNKRHYSWFSNFLTGKCTFRVDHSF